MKELGVPGLGRSRAPARIAGLDNSARPGGDADLDEEDEVKLEMEQVRVKRIMDVLQAVLEE